MQTYRLDNSMIKAISQYWGKISPFILEWKTRYEWPRNTNFQDAIIIRNDLENRINKDLLEKEYLSKETVDYIFRWGFNMPSNNTEKEIAVQTQKAFSFLRNGHIESAALELIQLKGVGISRATKIIGLSNQYDFAIYDSRTGHSLKDLAIENKRILLIPTGRVIHGDKGVSSQMFCKEFVKYIAIIRELRDLAKNECFAEEFQRASDIEMALFSRSQLETEVENPHYPKSYRSFKQTKKPELNKHRELSAIKNTTNKIKLYTLGNGGRAKAFWITKEPNQIVFKTGGKGNSTFIFTIKDKEKIMQDFSEKGWFPLGNTVDNLTPGGLGEYVRNTLNKSAKNASHIASFLVHDGILDFRYGSRNSVELKVKK